MVSLLDVQEIEISYKNNVPKADRYIITCSQDAYAVFLKAFHEKVEYKELFYIMMLNNSNEVLGITKISEAGITGTLVDTRIVFQTALKAHATALILAHNHPSGKLEPSQADKNLTSKLKTAGEYLDIKVLDHLIITKEGHLSFADDNLL
ncbi:RadC family protein [Formosa undariae]|uniref:RadC family protein n=1 Tax=Formosa undariae TaxID=1325436 RepID=A0ABV5F6K0_9FLAO